MLKTADQYLRRNILLLRSLTQTTLQCCNNLGFTGTRRADDDCQIRGIERAIQRQRLLLGRLATLERLQYVRGQPADRASSRSRNRNPFQQPFQLRQPLARVNRLLGCQATLTHRTLAGKRQIQPALPRFRSDVGLTRRLFENHAIWLEANSPPRSIGSPLSLLG
ncbi:hypothetical protein FQZ97_878110 [compost metagenome]